MKTCIDNSVNIGGNQTITGQKTFTGATTLSGATSCGSTLDVTGATSLSSTLNVAGATTLTGDLTTNKPIKFTHTNAGVVFNPNSNTANIIMHGDGFRYWMQRHSQSVEYIDNSGNLYIGSANIPVYLWDGSNFSPPLMQAGISLSQNGYLELSNGVIMQWGYYEPTTSPYVVTLPIPFTTTNYSVVTTVIRTGGGTSWYGQVNTKTTTDFTFVPDGSSMPMNWIAIGY